jgi:hypothetical protein
VRNTVGLIQKQQASLVPATKAKLLGEPETRVSLVGWRNISMQCIHSLESVATSRVGQCRC